MKIKRGYEDDFPVIVEEFSEGKINRERATRELLFIGLTEAEVSAVLAEPARYLSRGAAASALDFIDALNENEEAPASHG